MLHQVACACVLYAYVIVYGYVCVISVWYNCVVCVVVTMADRTQLLALKHQNEGVRHSARTQLEVRTVSVKGTFEILVIVSLFVVCVVQ